ncbi:hypothetical protein LB504_012940 [Fusarium proliferatum]|nr:hypothetical protein LB504_012940 [Fusarium proliferatum]
MQQPDHVLTEPLAASEFRVTQTTAARRGYPNTRTESLIKRLVIFCHQNRSKEGLRQANGYHFSTHGARLMSHVCDFMQTRTHGLSGATCADVGIPESIAAVRYNLAALADLNKTLETADPIAILGIAAFAFFEVCDGAFGEWQRHLHGARSVLDCHCRTHAELERLSHDIAGLKEIISHLVWYDAMGAIIRGSTGLIFEDWHRELLTEEFFTMVGCPGETFGLLVSIAREDVNTGALGICLQGLEQVLRIEPNSPELTESSASAVAFRCAAIVALLSRVNDDSVTRIRETTIFTAVDRLCQAIMSVPSTSKFYEHMQRQGTNATLCDVTGNAAVQRISLGILTLTRGAKRSGDKGD